jgi:hypothetical protein
MSHPSLVKHHQVLEFRLTNLIVKFLDSSIALSEKFNFLLGKVAYVPVESSSYSSTWYLHTGTSRRR